MNQPRTLIVGLGSPHGDDQIGWLIVDELTGRSLPKGICARKAGSPVEILNWLEEVERLVVCDACQGLGHPGEIRCWQWPAEELPALSWTGTHDLSLPAVLMLAGELGLLPPRVIIWGIESQADGPLSPVAPEVIQRVSGIVNQILQGLKTPD